MKNFGTKIFTFATVICLAVSLYPFTALGGKMYLVGTELPEFTLPSPWSFEVQRYLGLQKLKSFTLSEISADLIFLEVFNAFCLLCEDQTPVADQIFNRIQGDPALVGRVKMIGIAAGNKVIEIERYKSRQGVLFPVFGDPELEIYEKLGKPGIPFHIVTTPQGRVVFSHYGILDDVNEFLKQVKGLLK